MGHGGRRSRFQLVGPVDRRWTRSVRRRFIKTVSWPIRLIQTGYVQNYALVMVLGVLIFIGYVLWGNP